MKGKVGLFLTLAALGAGLVVTGVSGADKEEPKAAQPAGKEIKSTSEKYTAASSVNFAGALELSFPSLITLGARIDQARHNADPVALAAAAQELAAAEAVAEKKADLTADTIRKEAVQLAQLRRNSRELKAVALLAGEGDRKKLEDAAADARKAEDQQAARVKAGERARGIHHELIVNNHTPFHLHIYVNGSEVGHIDGWGHAHFHVHTHGETVLDAYGAGRHFHTHQYGEVPYYTWTLH